MFFLLWWQSHWQWWEFLGEKIIPWDRCTTDTFILCGSAVLFAPLRVLSFLGMAAHMPWGPIEPPGGLVRDLSYQSLHPAWISKLRPWRIGKHLPPVFPSDSPSNNPFLLYSISPLTAQEMRYWHFANDGDSKKSQNHGFKNFFSLAVTSVKKVEAG